VEGKMNIEKCLDTIIFYLLLVYALFSGIARGGVHTTIALLVLFGIVRYLYKPFKIEIDAGVSRGMLVLAAALILSSAFSFNSKVSMEFFAYTVLRMLPFFIVLAYIKDQKMIEKIVKIMAGSILLGSFVAIWQGLHGGVRVTSYLGIMDFAGVIGLVFPVLVVYGFEFKGKVGREKYIFLAVATIVVPALIYNGTRAVWIAAFVSLMLYILLNVKRDKKLVPVAAIILISLLGIGLTDQYVGNRVHSISNTTTDTSNVKRINMWKFAGGILAENPIFGIGLGCLPPANSLDGTVPIYPIRGVTNGDHVHNNFLQIAAENGIVGLGAFCYLFGTILYSTWKKMQSEATRKWATIAFLCTIDFLMHGLFEYTFKMTIVMYTYWFILGLAYMNFRLKKEEQN
jgi:O-antigen ligase